MICAGLLCIFAPLIAAAFILLAFRQRHAKYIALAGSLASFALAVYAIMQQSATYSLTWFSLYGISISISVQTMLLNKVLLALVALITPFIIYYSFGYMDVLSEQKRFYFEMCIFAASMMLFSISANFISLFIAWEFLGITSYLLIGFWHSRPNALHAARKALTTIFLGDMLLFIAFVAIYIQEGTFQFSSYLPSMAASIKIPLALIAIAVFTKSAQAPFNEWLADAMEGPTPVSAFLHSSTMVKAGVFLVMLLFPLYKAAGMLWIFLVFGIATAIIAISNAVTEHHIKRVLAYSTMEDLALMFIALGLGNLYVALLLFVVQTFYKALLFMASGSIMRANDEEVDIYKIFNTKRSKVLYASMLIGIFSLCGIFPFGGFFAKAAIDSIGNPAYAAAILIVIDFGSALYAFRWLILPSRHLINSKVPPISYKMVPKSMQLSELALAVLTAISAVAFFYIHVFISIAAAIAMLLSIAAGIAAAYMLYAKGKLFPVPLNSKKRKLLYNNLAINWFYATAAKAFLLLSEYFDTFDEMLGRFIGDAGNAVLAFGKQLKLIVSGHVDTYGFAAIIGIIIIILAVAGSVGL